MRKKFLLVAIACSLIGTSVVFAKVIPGVTEPYNPSAYYDPMAKDYEDSPSIFTMKDLARNGFQVKDVPRKMKSVLFGNDFETLANIFIQKTLNQIANLTGLDSMRSAIVLKNLRTTAEDTKKIAMASSASDSQEKFMTMDSDLRNKFEESGQLEAMQAVYKKALLAADDTMRSNEQRLNNINNALENSANAQGELEAHMANTEIEAICAMEIQRRNVLLGNYIAVEAVRSMKEEDQRIKDIKRGQDGAFFKVADPYVKGKTERPAAPGFVDF